MANLASVVILFFVFITSGVAVSATVFTLQNSCPYTVWPGTFSSNGETLGGGGFQLDSGASKPLTLNGPPGWSGRFWPRTGCNFDSSGRGNCATGDCGGLLNCTVTGATPSTLAEFTIQGDSGNDFYDLSLVDGYNVKMGIKPIKPDGGSGDCKYTGCAADLNADCPEELRVLDPNNNGNVVACKSACAKFGTEEYCCTGAHSTAETCPPTDYSKKFKSACPTAYSYAKDDLSTFSCSGANYVITFCP